MARLAKLSGLDGNQRISLTEISKQEKISKKFLEQLFSDLKKAGLVKAKKGASGGYQLSKKPEKISVYKIIEALEGEMIFLECLKTQRGYRCIGQSGCGAVGVLSQIQKTIINSLKKMTLQNVIDKHK